MEGPAVTSRGDERPRRSRRLRDTKARTSGREIFFGDRTAPLKPKDGLNGPPGREDAGEARHTTQAAASRFFAAGNNSARSG